MLYDIGERSWICSPVDPVKGLRCRYTRARPRMKSCFRQQALVRAPWELSIGCRLLAPNRLGFRPVARTPLAAKVSNSLTTGSILADHLAIGLYKECILCLWSVCRAVAVNELSDGLSWRVVTPFIH